MKAIIKESGFVVAEHVESALSFKTRLLGLMFRRAMQAGTGLWLCPCKQVHTCFMRFDMDGLFLASDGTVLHVLEHMRPWGITPIIWGAHSILELPGGTLAGQVQVGQRLEWTD